MKKLGKDKTIWVKQVFSEELWRYEKVKLIDYNNFLKTIVDDGPNPFLKMEKAPKYIVAFKKTLEFLSNKYVDKVIFIIIGYFLKILLDKII